MEMRDGVLWGEGDGVLQGKGDDGMRALGGWWGRRKKRRRGGCGGVGVWAEGLG